MSALDEQLRDWARSQERPDTAAQIVAAQIVDIALRDHATAADQVEYGNDKGASFGLTPFEYTAPAVEIAAPTQKLETGDDSNTLNPWEVDDLATTDNLLAGGQLTLT